MGKKKKELSPEEARAERRRKAEKKKEALKRRTSAAAVMGALFSFIFVGTVLILLFKINNAVKERDNAPVTEPFRGPALAVTEVSSSAADSVGSAAETTTVTTAAPETATTTTADPLVVMPSGNGETIVKKRLKNAAHSIYELDPLKAEIEKLINGYQGEWQVYFRHTGSNKEFSINSRPVYAAGLMKLFASGAVYQKSANGNIGYDYADDLVRQMLGDSESYPFDQAIIELGQSTVTDWCRQQGYWDTVMSETDHSYEGGYINDTANVTSVSDVGRCLSNLYRGKVVGREYSDKMLDYLKTQPMRNKIPAGVPNGITVANKTGDSEDADHDAAIIYCDTGDYILVVMGETTAFGWTADDYVTQISELVYKYFNGDPNADNYDDDEVERNLSSSADSSSESSEETGEEDGGEDIGTE